jgi:hypothetical protein
MKAMNEKKQVKIKNLKEEIQRTRRKERRGKEEKN